jgi:hypothetical protein
MQETQLIAHICPICAKEFYPTPDYAYKLRMFREGTYLLCSYHCLQEAKKINERRRKTYDADRAVRTTRKKFLSEFTVRVKQYIDIEHSEKPDEKVFSEADVLRIVEKIAGEMLKGAKK